MTYAIAFLLGCIVSTLAFNYLVFQPYRKRVLEATERTKALADNVRLLFEKLKEKIEEARVDEPVLSPIQKIRDGS